MIDPERGKKDNHEARQREYRGRPARKLGDATGVCQVQREKKEEQQEEGKVDVAQVNGGEWVHGSIANRDAAVPGQERPKENESDPVPCSFPSEFRHNRSPP